MKLLYDISAPRTPTNLAVTRNLTVNSDLLLKSRVLNINLSAVLEQALSQQLAEHDPIATLEHLRAELLASLDFVVSGI